MSVGIGRERQFEVYVGGARGSYPTVPVSFARLEEAARRRMSPEGYAYVAGGAGTEETMRENRAAFERWRIVPRMLRDVSAPRHGRRGARHADVEPVRAVPDRRPRDGARRRGRRGRARGGCRGRPVHLLQPGVARRWRRCAQAMGDAPRWFQLYWSTSNELVASLVSRAERMRLQAIVLTLDTTMLGWRIRDLDLAYLPFLRGKGIAQYTSDPVFVGGAPGDAAAGAAARADGSRSPRSGRCSTRRARTRDHASRTCAPAWPGPRCAVRRDYSRPSLSWDDLAFLRERTRLPILLKGILHPADAARRGRARHGRDRRLQPRRTPGGRRDRDHGRAACDRRGRRRANPVLLDSGIRSRRRRVPALALGASAVGLGRPYVGAWPPVERTACAR